MTQKSKELKTGYFSNFKPVEVTCSCTKCDSLFCFAKRHAVGSCSCENCTESKTCLFYNNRLTALNGSQTNATRDVSNVINPKLDSNLIPSETGYHVITSDAGYDINPSAIDYKFLTSVTGSTVTPSATGYNTTTSVTSQNVTPSVTCCGTTTSVIRENVIPSVTAHHTTISVNSQTVSPSITGYNIRTSLTRQDVTSSEITSTEQSFVPSVTCCNTKTSVTSQNVTPSVTDYDNTTSVTSQNVTPSGITYNNMTPATGQHIVPSVTGYNTMTSVTSQNDVPSKTCCNTKTSATSECVIPSVIGHNTMISATRQNIIPSVTGYNTMSSATSRNAISSETAYNTITSATGQNFISSVTGQTATQSINNAIHTYKPTKDTLELCRNIIGTPRPTLQELKNTYLHHNTHERCPLEPSSNIFEEEAYLTEIPKLEANSYTREICRSVLGMQKDAIKSLKHIYVTPTKVEDCDCSELSKPAGYVLDFEKPKPPNSTPECCVHVLDSEWNTIETPGNTYLPRDCDCAECMENQSETPEYLIDPPGYIVELPVSNYRGIKHAANNKPDINTNTIETLKNKYLPHVKSCKCRVGKTPRETAKNTIHICMNVSGAPTYNNAESQVCSPESPISEPKKRSHDPKRNKKYTELCKEILDIQKNTIDTLESIYLPHKTTCSCKGAENTCKSKKSDSPEHALELQKKKCHCDDSTKRKSDSPGHISEVPKHVGPLEKCGCKDTPSKKSDAPEYALQLQKCFHKKDPNKDCNCDGTSKNKSGLPGYMFDIPKYTEIKEKCGCKETPTKKSDSSQHALELHKCTYKKDPNKGCHCDGTSKNESDLPGYMFDVPKYTEIKEKCSCKETPTKKSDSSQHTLELHKCTHKKEPNKGCNCDGTSKNKSDLPGYTFDVPKYTEIKEKCGCKETPTKKSDSLQHTLELHKCTHKKDPNKGCNCDSTSKNKTDLPGYMFDVPKYTEIKEKCGCKETPTKKSDSSQHALELHKCTHKKDPNKGCHCDNTSKNKSELPGYMFDVPKNTEMKEKCCSKETPTKKSDSSQHASKLHKCTHKKDPNIGCNCDGTSKNKSDLPGYMFDVPKYTEIKEKCSCNETSKKISDSPEHALHKCTNKNEICNCNGTSKRKSDLPGYIFNVPKNTEPHDKCGCKDTPTKKSDSPESALHKCSHKNENCNCDDSLKRKSDLPGYIFNVPKYTEPQEKCGCKDTPAKKSDSPEYALHKCTHTNENCNCDDSSKRKSDLPGYIFNVPKYTEPQEKCGCKDTSMKKSDSPAYESKLQKCTHDKNQKENCNCDGTLKNKSDSPGYTFDVPKYIEGLEQCSCKGTPTNKSDSPKHELELLKCYHQKDQKEHCNCDNLQKNKLLVEKRSQKLAKNTQELLKSILAAQHDTIEILNKKNKKGCCEQCTNTEKNKFDTQKCSQKPKTQPAIETLNKDKKKSCHCNDKRKNKSDAPGYILELEKYKTIPLGTSKKSCECNESRKNKPDSRGYVIELDKYKNIPLETLKKMCECQSRKKKSDSSGHVFDIDKCKQSPHEQANDVQVFSLERLEKMKNTIDKLIKTCECNKFRKNKRDPAGYADLENHSTCKSAGVSKTTDEKCECKEPSKTNSQLSEYEPSKETYELCKSIFQTQGDTIESVNNTYETETNVCDNCNKLPECLKQKNPTPGDKIEAMCKTCTPDKDKYECDGSPECLEAKNFDCTKNAKQLYKNVARAQKNKIELVKSIYLPQQTFQQNTKHESAYNIQQIFKNISGIQNIKIELLKNIYLPNQSLNTNKQKICNNVTDNMKNKIELLKSIYLPDSSTQYTAIQDPTQSAHEIYRTVSETEKNKSELLKRVYLPHESPKRALELCKNILGNQENTMEMIKKIYLPKKNKAVSKHTFEICKNTLGITNKTVESLKNIYIPPRFTLDYTKKYEYPHLSEIQNKSLVATNTGTATLSAEVMDIPYTAFHDSVTCKHSNVSNKTKLSKYDIFKRIKEAYKACSCKVCECIAGKSVKKELCKCKPCECVECLGYMDKNDTKPSGEHDDAHNKCRCIQCNKIQCGRVTLEFNRQHTCECNPCGCVKCSYRGPAKKCKCEPCQCIDCKSMTIHQPQTLVVAPVGENVQRVACTCSPCDCIECGPIYSLGTTSVTHEVSTGINRHARCRCELCQNDACDQSGVDSCKCERHNKALKKPVEKETHDYDIHTATIIHNRNDKRDGRRKHMRHDTIAMFAAVPSSYPNFAPNKNVISETATCNCDECECITCICKEETVNAIKSSQLFSSHKTITISDLSIHLKSKLNFSKVCKCEPCECQVCGTLTNDDMLISSQASSSIQGKSCMCDICDCLSCEKRPRASNPKHLCKCSFCECKHCELNIKRDPKRFKNHCQCSTCRRERYFGDEMTWAIHPIKRGDFLTPSTHETKFQSMILEKRHFREPSFAIRKVASGKDCHSTTQDFSIYHALSRHESSSKQDNSSEFNCSIEMAPITQEINDINNSSIRQTNKSEIQYQERYKQNYSIKNNSIDNEISGSYVSGYSSFDTSPKTSCHKDCGSITPTSQNKNKSWESSCNSSGYDYPEYLIQFPKSTVETCLKDVMELDMDKTKLDKFNIVPHSGKHPVNKAFANISCKERCFEMRDCNRIHSSFSKLIACKKSNDHNGNSHSTYKPRTTEFTDSPHYFSNSSNVNFKNKQNSCDEVLQSEERKPLDRFSFNINNENSQYLNEIQNLKHFHAAHKVFDYNVAKRNTTGPISPMSNDRYGSWGYLQDSPHMYSVSGMFKLNINEDNRRVQKTLKEAKEFSLELVKLLDMYERANKEFQSISDKLTSHGSFLSGSDSPKEFYDRQKCIITEKQFSKIEHELHEIHLEVPSVREQITSTSIVQDQRKISERTITYGHNENKTILQKHPIYSSEKSRKSEEKKEQVIVNQHITIQNNQEINSNKNEVFQENEKTVATTGNRRIRNKERINSKNHKKYKYNRLLKRTIIIKRMTVRHPSLNESKPVVNNCVAVGTSTTLVSDPNTKANCDNTTLPANISVKDTEKETTAQKHSTFELSQIMRKLDTVFGNFEQMSVSTSTDTNGLEKNAEDCDLDNSSINHELEETKPWPILKKNFFWNSKPYTKSKEVCIFPSLELEIKQAVQSISLQTTLPKKKIMHHENKALANLQAEVKKLLDMPILQQQTLDVDYYADCTKRSMELRQKSKLESELKETPKLSLETYRKDVDYVEEKACSSYKAEGFVAKIRELLDITLLIPFFNEKTERNNNVGTSSRIPSIDGVCSCESLKVNFVGVRRVSDHTVLVKWNVPKNLTTIKGYELLVDGRAVQKIFSSSTCLAVVTCLPHADKVLLTIRTITSDLSVTGHYPAATIIYRPRVK